MRRYNPFTLIELLVVVSIISILMSMLLPALRKTRGTARKIQCANNIKQIGVAINLYNIENNGYYPRVRDLTYKTVAWPVILRNELGVKGDTEPTSDNLDQVAPERTAPGGLLLCPGTRLAPDAGAVMRYSYQGTVCVFHASDVNDPDRQGGFEYYNSASQGDGRYTSKKSTNVPPGSVLFIEKSLEERPTGFPYDFNFPQYSRPPMTYPVWSAAFRHGNTSNFLFADNHVESLTYGLRFDSNWIPDR